ncbi:MAG: HAMP domain-containing sensor histidine kinase [Candidatus Poribacteria bacterium]|nr:HAMP domain-containing sensor histidine kinase [Candidatus Poribacteria bacterium]
MARWNRSITSTYPTGGLMLIYFGVGVCILIFVFAYYTRQISHLNADIEAQIEIFVNLAAELPSIENRDLQERLLNVMRQELYAEGRSRRFSFIITDADGNVEISQGIDTKLDEKVNETETVSLTQDEQELLTSTLERMKNKNRRRKIPFLKEDRQIMGYLYHGYAAPSELAQLPYAFTDTEKNPQKWQMWKDVMTAENATPEEKERAKIFVQNTPAYVTLQTTPDLQEGYFYYEIKSFYGLLITPIVLSIVLPFFAFGSILIYRRIKSYEHAAIWGGLAKETAHQLGTPISALLAWTELLDERSQETGDKVLAELSTNMQSDLERLQKTTTRFGMIGTEPTKAEVNLEEVLEEVLTYFEKRLPQISRNINISVTPHNVPIISANAHLLQWVFENLIRNSLDAMHKEVGHIEIEPLYDDRQKHVVIRYSDNGSGIPSENQRSIFEPGMTTKTHGWGLGLTIVQRIVRDYHHGSIRLVESSPAGTTFEIRLPCTVP